MMQRTRTPNLPTRVGRAAVLAAALLACGCLSAPPLEDFELGGFDAARTSPSTARTGGDATGPVAAEPASSPQEGLAAAQRDFTPVLYARDGTPVSPRGAGATQANGLGTRELAGNGNGRMHILELYQNVIEERDTLAREVDALIEEVDYTRQALATADQRIGQLEAELQSALAEGDRLRMENVELAGRLTTAQIRRLQAEKILLEARLTQIEAAAVPPATAPAAELPNAEAPR